MMTAHTSAPHHMVAASITFLQLRIIASNLINTTGSRRRSPCRTLHNSPTYRTTPPRHTEPHRRTTSRHHMDSSKNNSTRMSILDLQYLQFGTPPRPAPPPPTTPCPPGTTSSSSASSASRLVFATN